MSKIDNFTKEQLEEIVQNSYSLREVLKAIGYTVTGDNNNTLKKRLQEYNIDYSHFSLKGRNRTVRNEENVFCINSTASQKTLRSWYEKGNYTEYKCAICGQEPFWNGKKLTLTLDHINGHNHDDRLENLRWICPNCDRQLDTFAGKNLLNK